MTLREQMRWWLIGIAIFAAVLWLFSGILGPFLLGMAIAYLADPVTDRLGRLGLGRTGATVVVTLVGLGIGVVALLVIVPAVVSQIASVISALPELIAEIGAIAAAWREQGGVLGELVESGAATLKANAADWSARVLAGAWASGLALIDTVILLVVTPVVAFYLLLDWDAMLDQIDRWLPRPERPEIRRLAGEIDKVLAGFVRGQLTVCLILGSFYAIALTLIGLPFGLLVGLFAGLISFVPYVGSILGGALSIGLALANFWGDWWMIGGVAAIFVIGQAVEGNVLTPKLVGRSVGLHPVWLMFALSAFGALFGFVGLLVAVPAAASIGVLGRYGIERYMQGRFYRGERDRVAAAEDREPDPQPEPQLEPEPEAGQAEGGSR